MDSSRRGNWAEEKLNSYFILKKEDISENGVPRRGNWAKEQFLLLFSKNKRFLEMDPPKGQLGGRKTLKIYKRIYDQLTYFKNTSNGLIINSNTLKYIKPDQ